MSAGLPKRILMTADTVGGVWCYATELIRALDGYGVAVLLATMGDRVSKAQREEISELGNAELAESHYKLEWMNEPWRDIQAAGEWLLGLDESFRPDVIHLNGYAHGALPWRAPKIVAGHSCVLSWWRGVKGEEAPAEWNTYRDAVRRGLSAADAVVTPTRAMLECLVENYGPLRVAEVIPNGRRLDSFRPEKKENFILSVGRLWDEAKNVRAVCACSLPWPVCVAGETQHPNGNAQAADLAKVRCLGKLGGREMVDWFSRASIYALPARYEPFGLSVLEAGLSECALVLGDIPSLRENWDGAAIFVNDSTLEAALRELIENEPRRHALGKAARERALQFDINFTARRYLDLYEQVAARQTSEEYALA
jgi:glycogen(starch) synthase